MMDRCGQKQAADALDDQGHTTHVCTILRTRTCSRSSYLLLVGAVRGHQLRVVVASTPQLTRVTRWTLSLKWLLFAPCSALYCTHALAPHVTTSMKVDLRPGVSLTGGLVAQTRRWRRVRFLHRHGDAAKQCRTVRALVVAVASMTACLPTVSTLECMLNSIYNAAAIGANESLACTRVRKL